MSDMDPQAMTVLEEIIRYSGLAPERKPGDFTTSECANAMSRSEPTVRRILDRQVVAGVLDSEQRFDPASKRVVRVWWKVGEFDDVVLCS